MKQNIVFTGGTCSGGHGLSIVSVGGRDDDMVTNITISNSVLTNSANGLRIKTVSGAKGLVDQVKYLNVTISNITDCGIVIEQDYENGGPTSEPTTGVPITGLVANVAYGTVNDDATNVYVLCLDGSCSSWTWEGIEVTGGKKVNCTNAPQGVSC